MFKTAKKQLQDITMPEVEALLKEKLSQQYDKILITPNSLVRDDYVFAKMEYDIADRKVYKSEFILKSSIATIFSQFENNTSKDAIPFPTNEILKYTKKKEQLDIPAVLITSIPFDVDNGQLRQEQSYYFFPNNTYKEACYNCMGGCKVTCPKCDGAKMFICSNCDGDKKVTCPDCRGSLWVRCGAGFFSVGCGGSGKTQDGKRCKECAGKGEKRCKKCIRGEVKCDYCSGSGKVQCGKCNARGVINCSVCNANGYFGRITFLETNVSKKSHSKFITPIDENYLSEKELLRHIKEAPKQMIYKNINGDSTSDYDEFSLPFSNEFRQELGYDKIEFPLILQENIYYQIIPCVRIRYTHILTNQEYELSIINFFDNPEIIYHSNPEKTTISLKSIFKTIKYFFEKLFKTKNYLNKEDKYKEIVLIIYLAKADGTIVEEEKTHLTEIINNIDDFTNAQKKALFKLLNASALPELTEKDFIFNDQEKAKEVLEKLNQLTNVDNNASAEEKALLDKFSQHINK